jgi:predicted amidophosphoribosyltransferase
MDHDRELADRITDEVERSLSDPRPICRSCGTRATVAGLFQHWDYCPRCLLELLRLLRQTPHGPQEQRDVPK